ncbi:MAG: hypothetical protein ACTHKS_06875 [Gaiellaceae bacterium]
MEERTRRVGRNEALFRQVNEELESLEHTTRITEKTFGIVCECGDLRCKDRVDVPIAAYEEVRRASDLFLVIPGHEIPLTEEIVQSTVRYNVVRKREGGPAQIANATDPRSE